MIFTGEKVNALGFVPDKKYQVLKITGRSVDLYDQRNYDVIQISINYFENNFKKS